MDKLEVVFAAVKSKQDNCICDCCHGSGKVLKLRMPKTLYYDGKTLTTRYGDFWICNECRERLTAALDEKEAPNE